MSGRRCVQTAEESWDECAEERDQGQNTCDDWDKDCCDWAPCSWACKFFTWICVGWTWVSNIVCVAWKTVTAIVCIAWEWINVFVSVVGVIISAILSIPILGRLISEILNIITEIIWRVVNLVIDFVLGIFGLDLKKYVRVGIIILRDEKKQPTCSEIDIDNIYRQAKEIYLNAANIELSLEGIHTLEGKAPSNALHMSCDISSWGTDLWTAGSYYEWCSMRFWDSRISRVVGLSSPISIIVISTIDPVSTKGCSLGPLTDYVLVEGADPVCFAHEIGHCCGLILPMHDENPANLNNAICGGTKLKGWQRAIIRSSRHATYF
jgi:hypothetical protein